MAGRSVLGESELVRGANEIRLAEDARPQHERILRRETVGGVRAIDDLSTGHPASFKKRNAPAFFRRAEKIFGRL